LGASNTSAQILRALILRFPFFIELKFCKKGALKCLSLFTPLIACVCEIVVCAFGSDDGLTRFKSSTPAGKFFLFFLVNFWKIYVFDYGKNVLHTKILYIKILCFIHFFYNLNIWTEFAKFNDIFL
jgi:hypothetical protein